MKLLLIRRRRAGGSAARRLPAAAEVWLWRPCLGRHEDICHLAEIGGGR